MDMSSPFQDLQDDLLFSVLALLPLRSQCQAEVVCKRWLRMLRRPEFLQTLHPQLHSGSFTALQVDTRLLQVLILRSMGSKLLQPVGTWPQPSALKTVILMGCMLHACNTEQVLHLLLKHCPHLETVDIHQLMPVSNYLHIPINRDLVQAVNRHTSLRALVFNVEANFGVSFEQGEQRISVYDSLLEVFGLPKFHVSTLGFVFSHEPGFISPEWTDTLLWAALARAVVLHKPLKAVEVTVDDSIPESSCAGAFVTAIAEALQDHHTIPRLAFRNTVSVSLETLAPLLRAMRTSWPLQELVLYGCGRLGGSSSADTCHALVRALTGKRLQLLDLRESHVFIPDSLRQTLDELCDLVLADDPSTTYTRHLY